MIKLTESDLQRFWSKVDKTDSCWNWNGATRQGYGALKISHSGNVVQAHRLSWEIAFGEIGDGFLVCHDCDNHECVNPSHLFLGTHKDNMQDASFKNRLIRGEMSDESIKQIRLLHSQGIGVRRLSYKFNLAKSNIQNIVNRKTYKHVL